MASSSNRLVWIIIGACVLLTLLFVALPVTLFLFRSSIFGGKMPPALKRAHVATGSGLLAKREYWHERFFGDVTAIRSLPDGSVVIAGEGGARFFKPDGHIERELSWEDVDPNSPLKNPNLPPQVRESPLFRNAFFKQLPGAQVKIAQLAGGLAFVIKDRNDVAVYDDHGKRMWDYDPDWRKTRLFVDDAVAGEFHQPGKLEVVVSYGGGDGVSLFDADAKELWHSADGNVWQVSTAQEPGGPLQIVHTNAQGNLVVLDTDGKTVSDHDTATGYVSHFAVVPWRDTVAVVSCADGKAYVMGLRGQYFADVPMEGCDFLFEVRAARLQLGGKPAIAVIASNSLVDRSLLYLIDEQGKVYYGEVIADTCGSLASGGSPEHPELFVGCDDRVWEYRPAR